MILYYDNYITDSPLYSNSITPITCVRKSNSVYKQERKIDIAKYTLASYKIFPWSKVIIKIDAETTEDKEEFIKYAKSIFSNAEITPRRSNNQKEYCKTIEEIFKLNDEWIFYIPNNDHPIIANDISHIYKLLDKASKFKEKHQYVSIIFSMFSGYYNFYKLGKIFNFKNISKKEYNPLHDYTNQSQKNNPKYFRDICIIENDDTATSFINPKGDNTSCQIVHRDLLKHWFCSKNLGNVKIIRAEDVQHLVSTPNQVIITPKKEICAHFDGNSHIVWLTNYIRNDQIPPLFIPTGFFENNIKIAYGYSEYKEGYVNINPAAKYYSFKSKKNGTDLKFGLQDIPLFWKDKIKEIDINPNADLSYLLKKRNEYYETLHNPWKGLLYRIYLTVKFELYWIPRKINNLTFKIKLS